MNMVANGDRRCKVCEEGEKTPSSPDTITMPVIVSKVTLALSLLYFRLKPPQNGAVGKMNIPV